MGVASMMVGVELGTIVAVMGIIDGVWVASTGVSVLVRANPFPWVPSVGEGISAVCEEQAANTAPDVLKPANLKKLRRDILCEGCDEVVENPPVGI